MEVAISAGWFAAVRHLLLLLPCKKDIDKAGSYGLAAELQGGPRNEKCAFSGWFL